MGDQTRLCFVLRLLQLVVEVPDMLRHLHQANVGLEGCQALRPANGHRLLVRLQQKPNLQHARHCV